MGGDQQRVELRLFLLPAMSLTVNLLPRPFKLPKLDLCAYLCAVISNSLNLLNLVSRPVELLNRQSQCSTYGSAPRLSPTWSVSHSETQGQSSVLPGTRYFDTTHMGMRTMISWHLRAVR